MAQHRGVMTVAVHSCQRQLLVAATAMPRDFGTWASAAQLSFRSVGRLITVCRRLTLSMKLRVLARSARTQRPKGTGRTVWQSRLHASALVRVPVAIYVTWIREPDDEFRRSCRVRNDDAYPESEQGFTVVANTAYRVRIIDERSRRAQPIYNRSKQ
jgi:hypothetical protein